MTRKPSSVAIEDMAQRAPVALALADNDLRLLAVNETMVQWTGVPRDQLLGRRLPQFLTLPSQLYLETHVRPLLRMQQAVREVALELEGSPTLPVMLNADIGPDGSLHMALVHMKERHSYEQELRRARRAAEAAAARHALLAEAAPRLVAAKDELSTAMTATDLAASRLCDACSMHLLDGGSLRLTGHSPDPRPADRDLAEVPLQEVLDAAEPRFVNGTRGVSLPGGRVTAYAVFPLPAQQPLGTMTFFWQSVAAEPSQELLTEFVSFVALAVAAARSRDEARRAVAAREAFIGVLGHEFANPLSALQLQVKLWQRRHGSAEVPSDVEQLVSSMERNLDRMGRIVQDMLDVSRLRTGRFQLAPQQVDLVRLAGEVLARMQPTLAARGMEATLSGEEHVMAVADPTRIEQVLTNLLTNAAKYGGGPVEVRVAREDGRVRLHVRDHGPGIPEESRQKVFQRFERMGQDASTPGTGLGLSIVRQLIEAHGGKVWLEDTPGGGATFVMELPG